MIYSTEVTKFNHDKPEQLGWFSELIIKENNDGTIFDFMKKNAKFFNKKLEREWGSFKEYETEEEFCERCTDNRRFVIKIMDIPQFLDNNKIQSYIDFHKENPDIYFCFCFYRMSDYGPRLLKLMQESDMEFFYADYVRTWDMLNGFVNEGVSDVYIVEEMGFSLRTIAKNITKPKNVHIRVIPHVAQSSFPNTPAMKKFFIRPDDARETYWNLIDIFEFLNIQNPNASVTLARIYADQGWAGNLNEIISDFNEKIDNRDIVYKEFANLRRECGHRCMKGDICNICEQCGDIAKKIKEKGMVNDTYHVEISNT